MTDITEEDENAGNTQYGKGFDSSYFNNKLGKTYRSQSYLTSKLDFLKTKVPQLSKIDMMGFDQLQSLKVVGESKLKKEIDYFADDILNNSYYEWVGKKRLAMMKIKEREMRKEIMYKKHYAKKYLALNKTTGISNINLK